MTHEEFKTKYPNLEQTLQIMAADGNLQWSDDIGVPKWLEPPLDTYENQASQLTDDEKATFALGTDEARDEVIASTGFEALDDFLTEIFEGMLHDLFWRMPS